MMRHVPGTVEGNHRRIAVLAILAALLLPAGAAPSLAAEEADQLTIRGVVRAEDGTALEGIRALLLDKNTGNVVARTDTGADGDYRFEKLAPADYEVSVAIDPAIYECGTYRATLDDDPKRGVTTVDWTLYRKGKCQQCCGCGPSPSPA